VCALSFIQVIDMYGGLSLSLFVQGEGTSSLVPLGEELNVAWRVDGGRIPPQLALQALQLVVGDTAAEFRSPEQQELVCHAIGGRTSVFAMLPCGAGKSMCFILPAVYDLKQQLTPRTQVC
jgi:superfamily II DNA helicase RecQ